MKILHNTIAAILLAVPIASAGAQDNPLAGKWAVEMAVGMQMENGELTAVMGHGTLELAVQGDSLVGTLSTVPPQGQPARPASRLAAKLVPGMTTFTVKGSGKVNRNGDETTVETISVYTISATDDALTGTVERQIVGMEMPDAGPQPIKGTRIKM